LFSADPERGEFVIHQVNAGDTAWLLVGCALVLLMTPAPALFCGGMVRRKNVLSTLFAKTGAGV